MAALAGIELLKKLKENDAKLVRFIPKSGGEAIKADIVEIFFGKNKRSDGREGVTLIPKAGGSEGKTVFIPHDRLKGMQGRYAYGNPSPEKEEASPAPSKNSTKNNQKKVQKAPANDEAFDLESAREEMKELSTNLQDLAERAASLANFIETLEMRSPDEDEEPSPSPKPASKSNRKTNTKKQNNDEDEA